MDELSEINELSEKVQQESILSSIYQTVRSQKVISSKSQWIIDSCCWLNFDKLCDSDDGKDNVNVGKLFGKVNVDFFVKTRGMVL